MAKKKIAAKKKTGAQPTKAARPQRVDQLKKTPTYKVERGITKPPASRAGGILTPERVALEAMNVDHSFLITDKGVVKRTRDIIYRMQQACKKRFTLRRMPIGWRVWRIA